MEIYSASTDFGPGIDITMQDAEGDDLTITLVEPHLYLPESEWGFLLTREKVRELLPRLQHWLDHPGEVPQVELPEVETRWVNVYREIGTYAGEFLFRDKETGKSVGEKSDDYIGTFPIQIPKAKE